MSATGEERIAVIGLGYVGLPVALAMARGFADTVGYDIDPARVAGLTAGRDVTGEVSAADLASTRLRITDRPADLAGATAFIVTVPTPIDANRQPDLAPLRAACRTIGPHLRRGSVVVFESTVYPGVTETVCGPLLAETAGLTAGADFTLGYSPERINPGDPTHRFETITKIVAGQDPATTERLAALYGRVVRAPLHRAPSIRVAEAAKVIENVQRDLNIALMNELAVIFERLDLDTTAVLDAAATKWNFQRFTPGLVGGHCIGVDPYYLTALAEAVGYHPEVILAGRRINDSMGAFIARKTVKLLVAAGRPVGGARVAVFGLAFKADVPDLRNSRVPGIVTELADYGITALIDDPLIDPDAAATRYGLHLSDPAALHGLDALILAVPHRVYRDQGAAGLAARLSAGGVLVDVKAVLDPRTMPAGLHYWRL